MLRSRQEKRVKRRTKLLLWLLNEGPSYGYDMSRGTKLSAYHLYPLLTKLENEGLVSGDRWDAGENPRRIYELTNVGKRIAEDLRTVNKEETI